MLDPAEPPIDLAKCLTSGQVFRFRREGDAWVGVDGERAYRLTERDGQIHVQGDQEAFRSFFRLDWSYGTPSPKPPPPPGTNIQQAEGESVIDRLIRLGPELLPFLESACGLRLLRPSCPREALFSFLCTSNNHISRITQMVGKLAAYGPPLPARNEEGEGLGDGVGSSYELRATSAELQTLKRFPTLDRIGEITEQELREKGFGYRAKTIPLVAHELLLRGGEPYLGSLKAKPYRDVYDELITLPGVGPKLADCIALYAFDKTEATPIDVHMWRAACPVYLPQWVGTDLTALKGRALGEYLRDRFGELAAVAQQVLFYSSLTSTR